MKIVGTYLRPSATRNSQLKNFKKKKKKRTSTSLKNQRHSQKYFLTLSVRRHNGPFLEITIKLIIQTFFILKVSHCN